MANWILIIIAFFIGVGVGFTGLYYAHQVYEMAMRAVYRATEYFR